MSLKLLFHTVGAVSFAYSCYYDWNYVIIPPNVHRMGINFAGKLKFLTYWNALIQTFYFSLCVLVDISNSSSLKKLRDQLHSSIAYPIAMFVGFTFWGIYAVDRELIFPRAIDAYFPTWLNHVMHTNVVIFMIIETVITFREYPKRSSGIKALAVFLLCYLVWMHVIYFISGFWVYPIMEVLPTPLRIVFFIFLFAFVAVLYVIGEKLNNYVWKHRLTQKSD